MRRGVGGARVVRAQRGGGYGFGSAARVDQCHHGRNISSRRFAGAYASPALRPDHPRPASMEVSSS